MSLITYLNPTVVKDNSIEGIKIKDGSITSTKIDSSVASKKYVDDTIASAISASDAMVFKGTIGTGGTSESLPSAAIVGDTYKVIALTTIPGASSYTGLEETAKAGDLIVAISAEPKWIVVPSGDEAIDALVQPITWSDLKAKRDAGSLIPGMQYRITDYTCTTTQDATTSAGHVFDIIVTADGESTLNEVARAAKHEGDSYFANNDLNAWRVWYCLDNDTTRFAWADSTNGKGVIYRMIDEFNNDVPYDFKNIQFKYPINTDEYPDYYYTFTFSEDNTDCSLSMNDVCRSNTIKEYIITNDFNTAGKRKLNHIVFMGNWYFNNYFDCNCYNNVISTGSNDNFFGGGCHDNYMDLYCNGNYFSPNCSNNTLGGDSYNNVLGSWCSFNYIKESRNNTLGNYCSYNTFYWCNNNTLGNDCSYNSLGTWCDNNFLGNNCSYIKFASDSSAETKYEYYQNNHFGDGCQYILFKGAETASSSVQVQNYNFAQGLQGTSDAYLTIDGVRNRAFETKVAQNSNGELKIYCEADLIK